MSSRRNVREQFNPAAFRAKRCEETVSIRKQKREEGFLKRRLVMAGTGAGAPAAVGVSVSPMLAPQPDTALPPHILGAETLDSPVLDPAPGAGTTTATATAAAIAPAPVSGGVSFAQLAADLVSPSPDTQVAAVSTVRRILSTERAPPIDAVIAAGCLPPIVELLKSTNSKLQFEACWALTNIASGSRSNVRALVEAGAVPLLIRLLNDAEWEVREQAVWALGNVAGDSTGCRDFLLRSGCLEGVVCMVTAAASSPLSPNYLCNATWALSNLFRGKPPADLASVARALPLVGALLQHANSEVVTYALWAVAHAADGGDAYVRAVLDAGVYDRVIPHMRDRAEDRQLPAIRAVGSALSGCHEHTTAMLQKGVLGAYAVALQSASELVCKEVLWSLSNIAAGTPEQIGMLLAADLLGTVAQKLASGSRELCKESAWVVANLACSCTAEQVQDLVANHGLLAMIHLALGTKDTKLLGVLLTGLQNVLTVGSTLGIDNPYAIQIEQLGALDVLESLQHYANPKVYNLVEDILESFFELQDDYEEAPLDGAADGSGAPAAAAAAGATTATTAFGPIPSFGFNNPGSVSFFAQPSSSSSSQPSASPQGNIFFN